MNIARIAIVCIFSISVAACADLTTVSRRSKLPGGGRAIHLDAQQRLVYSNKDGSICAEPTPDAIQAVAASFGAGVSAPKEGSAAVANALQQSTSGVGLHTQSITLMREAYYRICEAYHNGKLESPDVANLFERSQDMTLGVLAIEQLTGAVVAKQVILGGSANSSASASVANTKALLDNAKRDESLKKKSYDDAQTQLQTDKDALAKAQAVTPATDDSTSQINDLSNKKIPDDNTKLSAAKDEYQRAQDATQAIEENFNAAMTSASAATTGTGQFGDSGSGAKNIDKDTAAAISGAVQNIVGSILAKGHLTDTCINFITRFVNTPQGNRTFDLCSKIIEADLKTDTNGHPFFSVQ